MNFGVGPNGIYFKGLLRQLLLRGVHGAQRQRSDHRRPVSAASAHPIDKTEAFLQRNGGSIKVSLVITFQVTIESFIRLANGVGGSYYVFSSF